MRRVSRGERRRLPKALVEHRIDGRARRDRPRNGVGGEERDARGDERHTCPAAERHQQHEHRQPGERGDDRAARARRGEGAVQQQERRGRNELLPARPRLEQRPQREREHDRVEHRERVGVGADSGIARALPPRRRHDRVVVVGREVYEPQDREDSRAREEREEEGASAVRAAAGPERDGSSDRHNGREARSAPEGEAGIRRPAGREECHRDEAGEGGGRAAGARKESACGSGIHECEHAELGEDHPPDEPPDGEVPRVDVPGGEADPDHELSEQELDSALELQTEPRATLAGVASRPAKPTSDAA